MFPPPAFHQAGHLTTAFNNSPNNFSNNNGFDISPQDNRSNLSFLDTSSHQLFHRRQTESDIFNRIHHPESGRKLSEPASPIPNIMISSPEDDHLQQQRSNIPTNPLKGTHLFGGYRSRRNSDNPHSPGTSTPGTPGSPESDFNSDPNSPQSDNHQTDELSQILNVLTDSNLMLETPTATLVSQPESSIGMDQFPPNSDPAVYTTLSAPSTFQQISLDRVQLENGNTAMSQIQEFEEILNIHAYPTQ